MRKYDTIGMMSGTSLDGLDIAYCTFQFENSEWSFEIKIAETIPYSATWKERLKNAPELEGQELKDLNKAYGYYLGFECRRFIENHRIKPELIASHGHTVFHEPDKGISLQIGDGFEILKQTGIATSFDFRTQDVKLGGQGAPLVPIGDHLLFSEYDYCINLGGFANISFEKNNQRIAFDICPVNIVINELCAGLGFLFDKDGTIAETGKIHTGLLDQLNKLNYYTLSPPKSLGKEWVIHNINPLLNHANISIEDKFRTFYEHCSSQICKIIDQTNNQKTLFTGGGAYNNFLMKLIKSQTTNNIIIPSNFLIEYKEAMIFAFLGVLKLRNEINCLASVTGAINDHSSGIILKL